MIGSSHVVNGIDPYYPAFYKGKTEHEAYTEYFESILDNLHSGADFDVYGHIDYVSDTVLTKINTIHMKSMPT